MAEYSGTPLSKKLGIKRAFRVKTKRAPTHYKDLLAPLPADAVVSPRLGAPVDIFHLFATSRTQLHADLERALQEIHQDGAIWVSWPKKASGVPTDVTEDVVRGLAFPLKLVDIKSCAVDDTWSALKLVIRKSHRGVNVPGESKRWP